MKKQFTLKVENKLVDYLQRLGFDIDSRLAVIDRMFVNHKDDTDSSVFESIPWKKYSKELEKTQAEYNIAKDEFSELLIPLVEKKTGVSGTKFDWKIENFKDGEVIITVNE